MSGSSEREVAEGMTAQRWRALSPLLDQALSLQGAEREAWLVQLGVRDSRLARELRTMLADHDAANAEAFLDRPVASPGRMAALDLRGTRLGAYTLESHIGQGGMANVWLARHHDSTQRTQVAVKIVNAALHCPEAVERFLREGSILARLVHPHIARLLDIGVTVSGLAYLVLEYVNGQRIDCYCDEQRLSVPGRIQLFLQAARALSHVHAHGVVHCDVKPQNVLVSHGGYVKLVDFGIAMLADAGDAADRIPLAAGDLALTPQCAAPEQIQGGPVTAAADVYALGVLLYLLLTGRHPTGLQDEPAARYAQAIAETDPIPPSEAVAALLAGQGEGGARLAAERSVTPPVLQQMLRGALDRIVMRALQRNPAQRYASAEALAQDLQAYLRPTAAAVFH